MLWYSVLYCSILSLVCLCDILNHVLIYIWLSSSSGRGRSMDDQVLDLALFTVHFYVDCCYLVVSICIDPILSGLVILPED